MPVQGCCSATSTGSDARGIDYTDSDGTNGLGWILVDASFLPILELAAFANRLFHTC